ncbi:hypothetical protein LHV18_18130 [Providencia rettgeri]|uniref:hypothetical protein n=1 Tax=Providencia TaxID=586 RepID=UPI00065DBF76|nr:MULTISPECIES: hypothetical protein [Providencia]EIU7558024.1 hypothetical protein [Providencia rettgeri]ELR5135156.1 hypothetical protein [Providencia rettgeri]ELR5260222.1 hypothetical protein [Providencia rettgeri]MBQ0208735.1 hypothetical protein [Providencia rettgeri]MCB4842538.1 hypothetical protein [Providencia rettgeri]
MDICHLVAPDVPLEDAPKHAQHILNWLKQQGIIDPHFQHIEYGEVIYRPTPAYKEPILYVVNDEIVPTQLPEETLKNYLTIVTERTVFHAGGNGLGIYCPQCAKEQSEHSNAWGDTVSDWYEGRPEILGCFNCNFTAPLSGWNFDPQWAFGNLGFSFHNWDIQDCFIDQLEQVLGSKIITVYQHD